MSLTRVGLGTSGFLVASQSKLKKHPPTNMDSDRPLEDLSSFAGTLEVKLFDSWLKP